MRMEIIEASSNDWAVVWHTNGSTHYVKNLTWDEMLGHVAKLTMTGNPLFSPHVDGLVEWQWKAELPRITAGNKQ